MREILFRGKDIRGEWEYGVPVFSGLNNELAFMTQMHSNAHQVIPETVGQYTGLTDKNGKKIFEGDILKGSWNTIFKVVYDDCYLGFRAKEKTDFHNCIDYYGLNTIEVIGNIYDNPELLEVNK